MEWYDQYLVLKNQKGEIIWELLRSDFEAMNDEDAKRKMENAYRYTE